MAAKYTYKWANQVVSVWYAGAPRATEFVMRVLGLDKKSLVTILASDDPLWENVKSCRKLSLRLWQGALDAGRIMPYESIERSVRAYFDERKVRDMGDRKP